MKQPEYAAGAVCWRVVGTQILVLLIHRTKHRDISFPKGKVDPGETLAQTAVREVREETGLHVSLGATLGSIHYTLSNGRPKMVQYWAANVSEQAIYRSTFTPNGEVDALLWTPLSEVRGKLSYKKDKELFDVFTKLVEREAHDTFSVILLRHAQAAACDAEHPSDADRVLTTLGMGQAHTIAPTIAAYGRSRIYTSTATRCLQTVTPLSETLRRKIRAHSELSQDAWDSGTHELRSLIGTIIRNRRSAVICSHQPVLPDVANELALATGSIPGSYLTDAALLPVSGFSVFHFSRRHPSAGILSVETFPKLLR